ncbi:MAG: response regulator [Desulfobacterales bacterium]|jgi:PAS domain S-box-containing protein
MPKNHESKTDPGDILIVDDETHNLQLLSELLGREGYQVRPANNPKLAIDSALGQPPKLILLDVKMPEMGGFEVCRRLKQDERACDIPIIFVSALQDVRDRVLGFEAGGVDFISKPFQEEEILARVRTHMNLRNLQLNLEGIVAERTADLAKSEARYRSLVENSLIGVFVTTGDGRLEFVNDAMARMFDFDSPESMIARGSLERWNDLKDRERMLVELQKNGSVTNFEAQTVTDADRHLHVIFSAKLLGDKVYGMVMDISERKQFENKIVEYQQRLKALAYKVTITEERERRAIAADLHDHVGQSLALARMQLASAHKSAADSALADKLDALSDTLLKALEDTQSLMLELSSHSMHDTGLSSAISDWLEGEIRNRHHIETEVIDHLPASRRKMVTPDMRTILFRNVRELVVNVIKHARAKKVCVRLEDRNTSLRIIVEDDGVGFDPGAAAQTGNKIGGFGLFSIEELMADIGGNLKIVSEPGKGCTAILSAPFGDDQSNERE